MAAEWLRLATLPDQLEVVIGDVVVGRSGLVSATRFPRWVRLGLMTGNLVVIGAGGWWLLGDGPLLVVVAAGLLSAWGHALWERRKKAVLTDPVLAQAAVRAARTLGAESQPGRWRIRGPQATELGRELIRLHAMRTPPGPGDYDQRREAALLNAAAPVLRPFMHRSAAGGRPLAALDASDLEPAGEGVRHEPGAPWPLLSEPEEEWPVLPPNAGGG
jgi:hypothetical protein